MTTVSTRLRVTAQTRHEGQVEVEDVLQPLNGGSGLVGEDLDEIGTSLVTSRLHCVIVELLDAVLNLVIDLGTGKGAVDARSGLGRVTAEEACKMSAFSCADSRSEAINIPCLSRTVTLPPAR